MKNLRIAILVFFLVVFAVFLVTRVQEILTSDFRAPVISADSDTLSVSVTASEQDLLSGMTAEDNLDGDVTNTLMVVSRSKLIRKGTLKVNYAAFDRNNNVGTYSREVTYTDYVSPRFAISAPLRFPSGNSNNNILTNVRAEDCLDGNISSQIKITYGDTESISDSVSRQMVNLQVTNSVGDNAVLQLPVTFETHDSYSVPAPALSDYVIYLRAGEKPDLPALVTGVWTSGAVRRWSETRYDPSTDLRINDTSVNYNAPGIYTVTYQLSTLNTAGVRGELGSATLIVIVEE